MTCSYCKGQGTTWRTSLGRQPYVGTCDYCNGTGSVTATVATNLAARWTHTHPTEPGRYSLLAPMGGDPIQVEIRRANYLSGKALEVAEGKRRFPLWSYGEGWPFRREEDL